jgi:hypothetical protein
MRAATSEFGTFETCGDDVRRSARGGSSDIERTNWRACLHEIKHDRSGSSPARMAHGEALQPAWATT